MGAEVATAATGTGLVAAASSASLLGAKEVDDDEFTPEEEEEAIGTNRFMAYCQTGISLIQLTVCSIKFKVGWPRREPLLRIESCCHRLWQTCEPAFFFRLQSNPLENGVTIGFVSVSIPLAFMGTLPAGFRSSVEKGHVFTSCDSLTLPLSSALIRFISAEPSRGGVRGRNHADLSGVQCTPSLNFFSRVPLLPVCL